MAFVQGGGDGTRLVFLTPTVSVKVWASKCEACWTPAEMPFKYGEAPLLVANDGSSDFPRVKQFASQTKCPSLENGLSSRLRSRCRPLCPAMAEEVVSVYQRHREDRGASALASDYFEALPFVKKIDHDREATFRRLVRELRGGRVA